MTVVRTMLPEEFGAVRELTISAFDDDASLGVLLDALRSSWCWEDGLSFVAELDGQLVGQVLYTHAILDADPRLVDVLLLSPIGVRPDLQRSGIGRALITQSMEVLERRAEPMVFLEGHPSYYPQFGFEPAGALGFRRPSTRIPPAAFMVRRFARCEPWMTGTLVYPDAFWRTDSVGLR